MQGRSIAKDILVGAVAGFAATLPMTATMVGIRRALPLWQRHSLPPRKITMRLARKVNVRKLLGRKRSKVLTAVSHFGYGAAMGAMYGPITPIIPAPKALSGTLFGLAVWAGSYFGLLPVAKILHPEEEQEKRHAMMAIAHVVWGGSLGVLVQLANKKLRNSNENVY